ncbi:MAG: M20/M25/M40 family metallo-hydrolase [Syntrophotalea acetylenica]|nr:M20/M25/M40 family metallo-hydrolase [Syntrophotalea acetylenica]
MLNRWEPLRGRLCRDRLHRMLWEMVEIYSPSGKEEDIQCYLEGILQSAGLEVHRDCLDETRFNLRCVMGQGEPDFYLVGHVDTVADFELQERGPRQQGGILCGLGSADMKAGCAAMIESFLTLAEHLPPEQRPSVGLLLAVGEEEDGAGSLAFLANHRPAWVVIGEPTGLQACFSHYGYLEVVLTTSGRRSHTSLPEHGHNAIESMLQVLLHLGRAPLLRRPDGGLVYSIREMNSSRAGFVVPDRCEALIDLHLPPALDLEKTVTTLRRRLASASRHIHGLELEVDIPWANRGYDLGTDHWPGHTLPGIYSRLERPLAFTAFRSHSDGNLFFEKGCHPLLLGPGALETAHTWSEQVSLEELDLAAAIYLGLCLAAPPPRQTRWLATEDSGDPERSEIRPVID